VRVLAALAAVTASRPQMLAMPVARTSEVVFESNSEAFGEGLATPGLRTPQGEVAEGFEFHGDLAATLGRQ